MRKGALFVIIAAIGISCIFGGCSERPKDEGASGRYIIMASDTILSTMIASIMPPDRYSVEAILPPGQCPGHYDVKLSDIAKIKKAALTVSFRGMPFTNDVVTNGGAHLLVDTDGRNWMAPDSYIYGLGVLADELAKVFPKDRTEIAARKERTIQEVKAGADRLVRGMHQCGLVGKPVIASFMQKETLEWMGLRVAAAYGREEAMSAREIVRLSKAGRKSRAIMVVDNLQSGPDTGKGVAEALKVPHVVLTNFPSEKGYLPTLSENAETVLGALRR